VTDNVENLILERLHCMDEKLDDLRGDVQDVKIRMTAAEKHLMGIQTSVYGLNQRMDRFDERLSRVERRLDLKDAA
jgi:predicted  nucleic acid-binding Zn-ribbon protein